MGAVEPWRKCARTQSILHKFNNKQCAGSDISVPVASLICWVWIDFVPETPVFHIVTLFEFDEKRRAHNSFANGILLISHLSRKLHDVTDQNHLSLNRLPHSQDRVYCCSARPNTE
jgi:hypothetical protein